MAITCEEETQERGTRGKEYGDSARGGVRRLNDKIHSFPPKGGEAEASLFCLTKTKRVLLVRYLGTYSIFQVDSKYL